MAINKAAKWNINFKNNPILAGAVKRSMLLVGAYDLQKWSINEQKSSSCPFYFSSGQQCQIYN
jgi:hypothetical protein